MTVLTAGYSLDRTPKDIRALASKAGFPEVTLLDVRRSQTHSRNPHWRGGGVGAVWSPSLGNLGKTARWIRPRGASLALRVNAELILAGEVLLLVCCERDWRRCHRRYVAQVLRELTGAKIIHLGDDEHDA